MKPETLLFWALYFYEKECKEGEKNECGNYSSRN